MTRRWLPALLLSACGVTGTADAGTDGGALQDASVDASVDAGVDAGLDAGPPLPTCSVMSAFELAALMAPGRDSDGYVPPTTDASASLGLSIRALARGDSSGARAMATNAGYTLCRGEGAEADLHLWAPMALDRGAARIAIRLEGESLVLEVPHPIFDSATAAEAAALFTDLRARALIVSGSHRCASPSASACDGTTSVCTGSPAGFRLSDAAHDVTGTFHAAHMAVAEGFGSDIVVSVHGMSGAGASVSNGTTDATTPGAPVARLALALAARFADVTSCNMGAGVPRTVLLCGTTNVQGRHLGASPDACRASPPGASERFVHLEQSRSMRDSVTSVVAAFREALAF